MQFLIGFASLVLGVQADEGMWLPQQLGQHAEQLRQDGVELPAGMVSDWRSGPLGAVGRIGHCTAAFVSRDGLLLTNGHCVRDYLQYASGEKGDLVHDGYLAGYTEEELWTGPAARLFIFEKSEDVTQRVEDGLRRGMKDADRFRAIQQARSTIAAACEADQPNRRCEVVEGNGEARYQLVVERVIQDLRIVYSPAEEIVFFGGERDNWAWPRHTGDVALLRAYVGPDGGTAGYSSDNVAFKPESFLTVSTEGVTDGQPVFQGGYPRETWRHHLASELEQATTVWYPRDLQITRALLDTLQGYAAMDRLAAARLRNPIFSLANREKYLRGMIEGLARTDLVRTRRNEEQALQSWIDADRDRHKRYGPVAAELHRQVDAHLATAERDALLGLDNAQLLSAARTAWRLAEERQKPDAQRRAGFHERDVEQIRDRFIELDSTLYLPAERDVTRQILSWLAALPSDQKGATFEGWLSAAGGVDSAVTMLFTSTPALASAERRVATLDMTTTQLEQSGDVWMRLAAAIERWVDETQDQHDAYMGAMSRLQPVWMDALSQMRQGQVYPDANGTLRVSTGRVRGCTPREGVIYTAITTADGMVQKSGMDGYSLPEAVFTRAIAPRPGVWMDATTGQVPLNFLTDLDNTAGNAGSPTINAKGQLVGLVFDGTYEALGSDWAYDPDVTRSIHVDVRFLLWMLGDVQGGAWLLEEMGVQ